MSNIGKRAVIIGFSILGAVCVTTSASAGEWRFHPERCPDLVEDHRDRAESRRDERVNRGPIDRLEDRLDRRESRRDERVTVCPRSAWVWHGGAKRSAKPAAVVAYYDWRAIAITARAATAGRFASLFTRPIKSQVPPRVA